MSGRTGAMVGDGDIRLLWGSAASASDRLFYASVHLEELMRTR